MSANFGLFIASTAWARSATSKTSPSPRTSKARSSAYESSRPSTTSPRRWAAIRAFLTAARRTRAFISSAVLRGPACRWRITTRDPRVNLRDSFYFSFSPLFTPRNFLVLTASGLLIPSCETPAARAIPLWREQSADFRGIKGEAVRGMTVLACFREYF